MEISAIVRNEAERHDATVRSGTVQQTVDIAPKVAARGSAVSGGELLMLALATCYCNDLFREAARLGVVLETVEIEATAEFPAIGLAARNVRYRARIGSPADAAAIERLLEETDAVAEVHNTLRNGVAVTRMGGAGPA